jgi:hypothetical protein
MDPEYKVVPTLILTNDNPNREVMLWCHSIERILSEWYDKCRNRALRHTKSAKRYTILQMSLVIPSSLIPLLLAAFSPLITHTHNIFIGGMILTGALTTSIGVMNPSGRSRQHRSFEAQYHELATEISTELVKPQRHRVEADVFLQRVMDKFNFLNNRAPPLRPLPTTSA